MKRILISCMILFLLSLSFVMAAPSVSITAPTNALRNQQFTVTVETSSDENIARIDIDYGDSTADSFSCSSGTSCNHDFSKSYFNKNTYTITVTVYDAITSSQDTHQLEIITPNAPNIEFSPSGNQDVKKDEEFTFTVIVSDDDFDFNSMRLYQDDLLVESLNKNSPECNTQGCTKAYQFSQSQEKTYVYKVEADDDEAHESSEQISINVEQDAPQLVFFNIETAKAGIDASYSKVLGNDVSFSARASSAENLKEIDMGKGKIDCQSTKVCEDTVSFSFDNLGEYTYSAKAITVSGRESESSSSIKLLITCPVNNTCCNQGSTTWNEQPKNKEDACDIGKLKDYYCSDKGESTFTFSGTDDDGDQFDQECFDCDDSNREIYPTNPNPYCDCNTTVFPTADSEIKCDDNQDNDCDGKIDCFDEDCPAYDPVNCKLECPPGETKCPQGYCTNLNTDVNNCGLCENSCEPFLNTLMTCDFGVCLVDRCADGFSNCDDSEPDCEINILRDANNCGECGKACPSSFVCREGKCKKLDINDDSWKTEKCFYGESIDCVTSQGCLGKRYCNNESESYGVCECDPYVAILSPLDDSYAERNISLIIETNMIPERCELSINSRNKQTLKNLENVYLFKPGNNSIFIDCSKGVITAGKMFKIDLPIEQTSFQEVSDELKVVPRFSFLPNEFNRETYYQTIESLEQNHEYSSSPQNSKIKFTYTPDRYLNNLDLYLQIPDCVSSQKIVPENGNYEIIDENTLKWRFSEINEKLEFSVEVNDTISEQCAGLFVLAPIAGTIGNKIDFDYWGLIPIILIPLLGVFFYTGSKIWHNRNQKLRNEENLETVIAQKKQDGETPTEIKQELEQDEINDQLIDESMKKEQKDEQQGQI
jgi:hypothetical protein